MRALLFGVFLFLACGLEEAQRPEGVSRDALASVTSFGSNPGGLEVYRYVPTGLPPGRPLVVLLHGCGGSAADFATSWPSWQTLANDRR